MRFEGNKTHRGSYSPFDRLAERYDDWFEDDGRLIFSTEVKALYPLLPMLPEPWLEIGVGSGRFAKALGIKLGIDPSGKLLEMAKQRGIDVILARGEDGVFRNETLGTVFMIVTICFLDSPMKVLQEANRILSPEGRLVLGLVLRESPWGEYYREKKADGHPFYDYATFSTINDITTLFQKTGYIIENTVSTLFQKPDNVKHTEEPREGYSPKAGFTVLVAAKRDNDAPDGKEE